MALIQCSQCQHHISKKAAACPQCGHPNEQQDLSPKERKVSLLLFLGIAFIPYIFSWFTLRKGYRPLTQVFALGWMAFILYYLAIDINMSKDTQTAQTTPPQNQGISYKQAEQEVGCKSRYSDDLKDDLFNNKYKDQWFIWTGNIKRSSSDSVSLDIDDFGSSDLLAYFTDPNAGYSLLEDDIITVKFKMLDVGGCFLPFVGKEAQII